MSFLLAFSSIFSFYFSKNFKPSNIQDPDAKLGQRVGLSEKDVMKLNLMYEDTCNTDESNVLEMFEINQIDPDDRFQFNQVVQPVMNWFKDFIGH